MSHAYIDAPVWIRYPARCWVKIDFSYAIQAMGWNDGWAYDFVFVHMEGRLLSLNNVMFVRITNVVEDDEVGSSG